MQDLSNTGSLLISQKSLDALWLRQKVISNNIANIDTPGYKSQRVAFEDILDKAIGSNPKNLINKITNIEPEIIENNTSQIREDGNNVDIDAENIELTRAEIQYQCMVQLISAEISRMKYAIKGGA